MGQWDGMKGDAALMPESQCQQLMFMQSNIQNGVANQHLAAQPTNTTACVTTGVIQHPSESSSLIYTNSNGRKYAATLICCFQFILE